MNAASTFGGRAAPAPTHETLDASLRRAADELARREPPAAVGEAVHAGLARRAASGRPSPLPSATPRRAWAGLALCGVVLVTSVVLMLAPDPPASADVHGASGFVPVAPLERWREAQNAGPAWIVATELPRERLAALGLPFDPARAGEPVRAELLLHPASGDVLAVRLLR